MSSYYELSKKIKYFEGWYFKHQKGKQIVVLIPGICIKGMSWLHPLRAVSEGELEKSFQDTCDSNYAFIQIITNDSSYCVYYSMKECHIAKDKLYIKIGDNVFSKRGVRINIHSKDICMRGCLQYANTTPIRYSIMGPFRFIPFMECKHEIISMHHKLQGSLKCNGKILEFDDGIGYIEKDWGHSFPKSYVWLNCNSFLHDKCSITVSIAEIPYLGLNFKGCICAIHYKGLEYRLATYLGVKIISNNNNEICLKQGRYLLKIQINQDNITASKPCSTDSQKVDIGNQLSRKLFAPKCGVMSKIIQEQIFCQVRIRLYEGTKLVFDLTSTEANLEIVE